MNYNAKTYHTAAPPALPCPDSVTVTIPWREFVAVFALIGTASDSGILNAKSLLCTKSKRPSSDLVPATDMYNLFTALKPIYTGEKN